MDLTALLAAYSTMAFSQGGAGGMFDVTIIHREKEACKWTWQGISKLPANRFVFSKHRLGT